MSEQKALSVYRDPGPLAPRPKPRYCVNCVFAYDPVDKKRGRALDPRGEGALYWKCRSSENISPVTGYPQTDIYCRDKNKNADCMEYVDIGNKKQDPKDVEIVRLRTKLKLSKRNNNLSNGYLVTAILIIMGLVTLILA